MDAILSQSRQMFEKLLFNETFLVKRGGDQFKKYPPKKYSF